MMPEIFTEIQIEAPADRVWNIIADFRRYKEWNPFIPFADGTAEMATELNVQIAPPGLMRSNYRLRITEVVPRARLRWLGRCFCAGLMDGDHLFAITPVGGDQCRLSQSESFTGILVPFVSYWLKRNLRHGFEDMNQALKKRAESRVPVAANFAANSGFNAIQ